VWLVTDRNVETMALANQDPTVQRRRLREALRREREDAGLKQAQVAGAMDWSPSKLIRIEGGQVNISTNDLKALLTFYGVKDQRRFDELLDLAKSARSPSFYDSYVHVLKDNFKEYLAHEGSASIIRQYYPQLISGLLQTEEYARAVLEQGFGVTGKAADDTWAVRQHRQEMHDRDSPPDMYFILDEAAIRRQMGGPKILRHQLERLREYAKTDHITLRVLPFSAGAHPGLGGNFILLEFTDSSLRDLLHMENANSTTLSDNVEDYAEHLEKFVRLAAMSLSKEETDRFLVEVIDELTEVIAKGSTGEGNAG
jgi:transcriptional regulator with XRE-family HTH domain